MAVIATSQIKLKELNNHSDIYDGTFFKEKAMWSESYKEKVTLKDIDILKSIDSKYGGNILKMNRGKCIYALNRIEIKNHHNYKVKIRAKTNNKGFISIGFVFFDHNNKVISNESINTITTSDNKKVITLSGLFQNEVFVETKNAINGNKGENFIILENEPLQTEWAEYETTINFNLQDNKIKSVKPVIGTGFFDDSYALIDCYLFNDITDIQSEINNIFADNVITPIEKNVLSTEWKRLQSEYTSLITSAIKYEIDSSYLTEKFNMLKTKLELVLKDMETIYDDNSKEVYDVITTYYQAVDLIKAEIENFIDKNISTKVNNDVDSVFNALTNNGKIQGIFLEDGKLYLNGEYIKANTIVSDHISADGITANKIKTGILTATTGGSYLNLDNGSMLLGNITNNNFLQWTGSELNIKASSMSIGANTVATESFATDTANSAAKKEASNAINNLSQDDVFNKLTNNGVNQGIYLQNSKIYINGEYVNAKKLSVTNTSGVQTLYIDNNGNVNLNVSSLKISSANVATQSYADSAASSAASSAFNGLTQKDVFNKLTNNGVTQGIYLQSNKIYINGEYISSNSISVDSLDSNNNNPIIKLFPNGDSYCSIDATYRFESGGKGNWLRLKWDKYNYWYVGQNSAGVYLAKSTNETNNEYDSHFWVSTSHARIKPNKFMIGSGTCRIDTDGGAMRLYTTSDGVLDRGIRIKADAGRLDVNETSVTFACINKNTGKDDWIKTLCYTDHTHSYYGYNDYAEFDCCMPTSHNGYAQYCGTTKQAWNYVCAFNLRYNNYGTNVSSLNMLDHNENINNDNDIKQFFSNYTELSKIPDIQTFDMRNRNSELGEYSYNEVFVINDRGESFVDGAKMSAYQSKCLEILIKENENLTDKLTQLEERLKKLEDNK